MTQDYQAPAPQTRDPDTAAFAKIQSLNTLSSISYLLHLIVAVGAVIPGGQFSVALLIAALVLDMLKRGEARGTWHESHFRWRIRSVAIAATLYCLTAPLWLLFFVPGWIAWTCISIWFLWRIVTGFLAMSQARVISE